MPAVLRSAVLKLTALLIACGDAPAGAPARDPASSVAVVDDLGRRVALAADARRVISLVPSATEMIVAMGGRDRLVARTDFDGDPALAELRSVGAGLEPSLEAIAALRPDLVIGWSVFRTADVVDRLDRMGIATYAAEPQTLEDLWHATADLGVLLGLEAAADSVATHIRGGLAELARETQGLGRPTVLYVLWHAPVTIAGPGTYLQDLITAAGGRNLFEDARTTWPEISVEEVVRRDPDALVLGGTDPGASRTPDWLRQPGWRELSAVRAGRVLVVDPDMFDRPGPNVVRAARTLGAFLHPGPVRPPGILGHAPAVPEGAFFQPLHVRAPRILGHAPGAPKGALPLATDVGLPGAPE